MTTVLITGSAGFLGTNLAKLYLENNYRVIGVDNYSTGLETNTISLKEIGGPNFLFINSNISHDWNFAEKIKINWLESLKYVFHFASPASPRYFEEMALEILWANTTGLANALKWADKYRARVIFASSSEVYGDPEVSPQPEMYWGNVNSFGPRSCYDESKRFGESLIYAHNKKYNTQHGLVRIFNTYGPGMNLTDGRVVINFVQQALKNEPITIYGSGLQTRSFCYVDDLVIALNKYAESAIHRPVNLGNDNEFTVLELAHLIINLTHSKSKVAYSKLPVNDPRKRVPDLTLAHTLLAGWKAAVSLPDGLQRTITAVTQILAQSNILKSNP